MRKKIFSPPYVKNNTMSIYLSSIYTLPFYHKDTQGIIILSSLSSTGVAVSKKACGIKPRLTEWRQQGKGQEGYLWLFPK